MAGQSVAIDTVVDRGAPERTWRFSDDQGSASTFIDDDGNATSQRFYPFGHQRLVTSTDTLIGEPVDPTTQELPTDRGYTNQTRDDSTGLLFYNARYYDPDTARFTQADTIIPNAANPADLNRYTYVRNSPLNYTDPSGHCGVPGATTAAACDAHFAQVNGQASNPNGYTSAPAVSYGGASAPGYSQAEMDHQKKTAQAALIGMGNGASNAFRADSWIVHETTGYNCAYLGDCGRTTTVATVFFTPFGDAPTGYEGVAAGSSRFGQISTEIVVETVATASLLKILRVAPRAATSQPVGGNGVVLSDGAGATRAEIAASTGGPTGGSRAGQSEVRQQLLDDANGLYECWRCGETTADARNVHVGHRNVPASKGGNLDRANVCLEGAACNPGAGNRGAPNPGRSCAERGSCGAPYGR